MVTVEASGDHSSRTTPNRVVYGITAGVSASNLLRGQLSWMRETRVVRVLGRRPGCSGERCRTARGGPAEGTHRDEPEYHPNG